MHIVHIAAENANLPGAKVGGIGDVIRDVPPALAELGHAVTVLIPSHGFLHQKAGAVFQADVHFPFRGGMHQAPMFEVPADIPHPRVRHLVIHHPWLEAFDSDTRRFQIYVNDPPDRPFFHDASRFGCFSSACAAALARRIIDKVDVIHLHDWHAAFVALLRRFHSHFIDLRSVRTVFSIHNVAMQGIRPLRDNHSSLDAWFPGMPYHWLDVSDPRWPGSINLMACGIRLADKVHTVSPTYAEEICRPGDKPHFYGGEGLEAALNHERQNGNLIGILNGCPYPQDRQPPRRSRSAMSSTFQHQINQWAAERPRLASVHFIARHNLANPPQNGSKRQMVLIGVARITEQKTLLFRQPGTAGRPALHQILEDLGDDGVFYLLGNGDEDYERFFTRSAGRYPNLVFLNGYSERCAELLYANGDLLIMPSSFEPCGISQMLAMREGCLCLVHATGGLRDTVRHHADGFCFAGDNAVQQADRFIDTLRGALAVWKNDRGRWQSMVDQAAARRFSWTESAQRYMEKLYRSNGG